MKNRANLLITFILGLFSAIAAAVIMIFGGNNLLPLSITCLIVGIVLISGSPLLAIRMKKNQE